MVLPNHNRAELSGVCGAPHGGVKEPTEYVVIMPGTPEHQMLEVLVSIKRALMTHGKVRDWEREGAHK